VSARTAPAATAAAPLPGEGTPDGARLREASAAFESGDHALVRAHVRALSGASDPKVADAAAALGRKVAVDPIQLGFLGVCMVALGIIFYLYVLR